MPSYLGDGGYWKDPQLWEVSDCVQGENYNVACLDLVFQLLVDEVYFPLGRGMRAVV